jgi:hypothetical protein
MRGEAYDLESWTLLRKIKYPFRDSEDRLRNDKRIPMGRQKTL